MGRYEDADGIWTFQVYREVYPAALHLPAASCGGRHFGAGGDPAGERGQRKRTDDAPFCGGYCKSNQAVSAETESAGDGRNLHRV